MQQTVSQKVVRNTIFNVLGMSWGILIALFLTPYIIRQIGVDRFGIWAIVGVLTGYFGLLDFGISSAFVKYISEFYARKDYEKINQSVNTGFTFYSVLAVIIIGLGFLLINPILHFFNIPAGLYNEARLVFLMGIMIFGVFNAFSSFGAIQGSLQRMDISNKVAIAISVPQVIGTILFLKLGYGLPGLMVNNAIILLISSIINIVIAFKILPELRLNPFLFTSKEMLKKLFGFGYKMQLARIFSFMTLTIDKLLITYFISIGLVTFYQLGSSIVGALKSVVLIPIPALLPAFSEMDAKGEREKLIEGYTRSAKYLSLMAIPLFTFLIISASQIMTVWMGDGYERSARIIQILALGHLCAVLAAGVGNPVLQGMGKPEYEMKAGLINIIVNLPLSVFLIIKFGFMGAAIATMLSWIIACGYYFVKVHQEIRLPIGSFIRTTFFKPAVICLLIGLLIWGLTTLFQGILFEPTRLTSLIVFIIQALLFFGIYLKALLYIKPLDNIDTMILFKDSPLFIRRLITPFTLS